MKNNKSEIELKGIGHNEIFSFGGCLFTADRNDEFSINGETFIGCKIGGKTVYINDCAFVKIIN